MKKNEQLDTLFSEWENGYPPYQGKFTRDGIIDEELYSKKKARQNAVLFIAREPNDKEQWGGDFRTWWKTSTWGIFSHRLGQWAYGINNEFPPFNIATHKAYEGLQLIAFMNLKKIGGGGNADEKVIMKCAYDTAEYLKREISIIDPDIIIGGHLYGEAWKLLFGDLEWKDTGYNIHVAKWFDTKIIGFYHPSNRLKKKFTYELLYNVCNSEVFKRL